MARARARARTCYLHDVSIASRVERDENVISPKLYSSTFNWKIRTLTKMALYYVINKQQLSDSN